MGVLPLWSAGLLDACGTEPRGEIRDGFARSLARVLSSMRGPPARPADTDGAARPASKAWFCPVYRYVARYFGQSITRSQTNHYDPNALAVCFLRTLSLLMQIAPKTQVMCNCWVTTTWHGDTMWHGTCSVGICRAVGWTMQTPAIARKSWPSGPRGRPALC